MKLRARDLQDMSVLSAVLQDAIVRPVDMTYVEREKRFVMVVSRFRWEHPEAELPVETEPEPEDDARFEEVGERTLFERVNAGVCFDRVRRVRTQGLDLRDREQILSLLAIDAQPRAVTLLFSGGAMVRLDVSAIACHLEDLGEPWATPWRPSHEDVATGAKG
jgi:hypothetical protein